jgi:hypothetical protein
VHFGSLYRPEGWALALSSQAPQALFLLSLGAVIFAGEIPIWSTPPSPIVCHVPHDEVRAAGWHSMCSLCYVRSPPPTLYLPCPLSNKAAKQAALDEAAKIFAGCIEHGTSGASGGITDVATLAVANFGYGQHRPLVVVRLS